MERKKVNVLESGMWAPRWPLAAPTLHLPLTTVCLTGGFESLRFQALFRPVAPGDDLVGPWGMGSFPVVCLECDSSRLALTRASSNPLVVGAQQRVGDACWSKGLFGADVVRILSVPDKYIPPIITQHVITNYCILPSLQIYRKNRN